MKKKFFTPASLIIIVILSSLNFLNAQVTGKIVSQSLDSRMVKLQVDFTSSIGVDSIAWDYGDGIQERFNWPSSVWDPTSPITSHSYSTSGTYLITSTVWAHIFDFIQGGFVPVQSMFSEDITVYNLIPEPNSYNNCGLTASISVQRSSPYYCFNGGSWEIPITSSTLNVYKTSVTPAILVAGSSASGSQNPGDNNINACQTIFEPGTYRAWYYISLESPLDTCIDTSYTDFIIERASNCNAEFTLFEDSLNPGNWFGYNLSTGSNIQYFWDFGDGVTSTLQYPSHTYASPGNYNISLIIMGDSCTDIHRDSASVFRLNSSPMMATLNILPPPTVGLQDNNETKFNLEAFPNPFDEVLKLKFSSTKPNIVQIKILDSMCRLVLSKTEKINESGNYYTEFDTSELSRGLYFISLSDDSGSYISSKIILKNN